MAMKFSINNDFSFNAKTYVPKQYDSKDIYSNISYDDIEDIDYSKGIDDSEDLSELEEVEKSLNLYNCVQQLTNDEIKKMEGLEYSFVQKTDLIYKYEGLVLDSNSGLLCTPEGYSSFLASNPDYRGISLDEYTLLYNMEFSKYMELNYGEALDYKTFKDKLKCLYDDYQSLGEVLYSLRQQQKALDFNEKYPLSDEDSYLSNGKIEVKLAQRPGSVRETDVILVFTLNGKQLTDQELTKLNPMEVLETLKNSPHSKYFSADNDMLKKYDFFEHLTDDQKNLYNRYYTKYGRGVADDYLESIKDTINAQVGYNEAMSAIDDALKKNGNISNSEMIVTAFGDGVSFFLEGVENLGDADGIKTSTQYKQLYIMQYLAENEPDKFTQMCYEFGFTVGNMAPSMAVSIALGPAGSTVASLGGQMAMGMSVLGNSRNEALISGSTEFKAWSYGVLSSMSEVTLGLMLGNIPFLNADASLSITGILEEGFEELLQEYVGAGLQASILGTPIDISQLEGDALKSFLFGCLLSMGSNTAVGTVNIVGNVLNINGKTVDLSNPNSIVEAIKEIDSNSSLNKNDSVDTTGGYELKEGESLSGKVGIQFFGGKTKNNSSNYFYDNIAHVNQMAQHGQFYAFDVQNFADIPSDFWSKINDPSLLFFRKDGKTYSFDDAKRLSESLNDVSKISVQNQTVVNNNTASPRRGFKLLNSVVAGAASDPNNVIPGVVKNQSTNINNVNSNAVFDNMVSKLGDNGARKALWFYVNNGDTKYIPVELLSQVQGISTDTINKFLDSKIKNKNLDNTNGYELKEGESLSGKVGIQFFGAKTSNVTSGVETNAGNGMVSSNVDTLNYGKVNTPKYILDYLASNIRKYAYRNTNSFTGLNDSIMKNGLYHFTGAADAIMSSGYIKASSFNKSYGNKKSFFFNGVPDVGAFAMNLDAVPVKTVAVKVVPNAELVNSSKLKLRYVDDMAITYDGNLDLKGLNVEKCFFGLEVEDGKLVYKQISESEYNSYENTDIAKNLMPYISNKSNIKNIKASFLNDISIRNRSNNNTDMSSVINSKAHDVNSDHGMQLDRRDFGGFYKTKIETGFFTEQQVANMLNRVNAFGYISSEAGEYYSSLFTEDYDIYVKTIHSSDLASIMSEGVRCLGTSTSGYGVAPTDINDINLDNTISGVDGTYDLINTLKSANGISQGGNPIDGTLVLKIPKGTNKNNILYFNQTSGTYCIKPEFIDSFSAVDANGVVAEPTFNNINDETLNLEKKIETKQQEYSVFKLQEINDDVSNYQEICDLFLSLTNDIETKNKLEEILYYGGYNGYGLDSNLSNKNNPYFEAQRRISMANLLITNPFTFDAVVKNNINLFHGTNSNALASILKYGLDNFDNLKSKEIQVSTGERWSRSSGRNFTSLTDVLNIAEGYSTINLDQFSFEVIIGTTVDEAKKSRIIPVGSDTPEVGIRNCLPVESIKTLLVPSDKVEFVKSIISNNEIEVLPYDIDKNNFYWFDYDSGMIVIDNDKVNEISASLKNNSVDILNDDLLREGESLRGKVGLQFFGDKTIRKGDAPGLPGFKPMDDLNTSNVVSVKRDAPGLPKFKPMEIIDSKNTENVVSSNKIVGNPISMISSFIVDGKIDVTKTIQVNINDQVLTSVVEKLSRGETDILSRLCYEGNIYECDLTDVIMKIYFEFVIKGVFKKDYFSIYELEKINSLTENQMNNLLLYGPGSTLYSIEPMFVEWDSSLLKKIDDLMCSVFKGMNGGELGISTDGSFCRKKYTMRAYLNPMNADVHVETVKRYVVKCIEEGLEVNIKMDGAGSVDVLNTDRMVIYFNDVRQLQILENVTEQIITEYKNAYGTPCLFGLSSNNRSYSFGIGNYSGTITGRQYVDSLYRIAYAKNLISTSTFIKDMLVSSFATKYGNSQAIKIVEDFINCNFKVDKNIFPCNELTFNGVGGQDISNEIIKIIRTCNLDKLPNIEINSFRKDIMLFHSLINFGDTNHLMNPAISKEMLLEGVVDYNSIPIYSADLFDGKIDGQFHNFLESDMDHVQVDDLLWHDEDSIVGDDYVLAEGESLRGKIGLQFFGGKTNNNSSSYFYDNVSHINQMAQHGQFYAFDIQNFADIPSDFWSKINDPSLLSFRKDGKKYTFEQAKELSQVSGVANTSENSISAVKESLLNGIKAMDQKYQRTIGLKSLREYIRTGNISLISSAGNFRNVVRSLDRATLVKCYNSILSDQK